jgi:uncharacterized membrane protein YphA (DoxX/SURF4 family)
MNESSSRIGSEGPVWKRVRLEVLALSGSLALAGSLLFLLPWDEGYSMLLKALGLALVLAGAIIAATRPWNFMRRMEMQLLVHKERLKSHMDEDRTRMESQLLKKEKDQDEP